MLDFILSIPLDIRIALVFVLGTFVGSAINWAIYRLAWNRRAIGPWAKPDPKAPPRQIWDKLPIIGWLSLQREVKIHGPGFWIRPMFLELGAGIGFAWLYWWEAVAARLVLPVTAQPGALDQASLLFVHAEFAAHVVLISLMLAASMIDVDEKMIPDEITVTGTLVALLMAAAWPMTLLPEIVPPGVVSFLNLASPNPWPAFLNGAPQSGSLAIGLACWWMWSMALLPRTWYSRHGLRRAMQLCCARICRERCTYRILRMALIGSVAVALVWYRGGSGWQGLLSALVGMAGAGAMIWGVRIVGSAVLQREAMGFGDVTLMAMVGAFLGWQPCLVIFFLAPFAGLIVGVARLIMFRDKEIPYGPFLCLATLFLIVFWYRIWVDNTDRFFALGWVVPLLMLGCLVLMGLMLGAWRLILTICCRAK